MGAVNTHYITLAFDSKPGNIRVSFTDTRFTFNTSIPLSASVHLCPFSCSPRPCAAIGSVIIFSTSNMGSWAFCPHSLFSFPLLGANLPLLPRSRPSSPFLSLSLPRSLVMTSACDTCGKLLRGPCFRRDTDILRVVGDGAILGTCKYENFLSWSISYIPVDQ